VIVSREVAVTTPPSRPPRSWNGEGEVLGVVPVAARRSPRSAWYCRIFINKHIYIYISKYIHESIFTYKYIPMYIYIYMKIYIGTSCKTAGRLDE